MPFPNYGQFPTPENLYTLAEISARSLINRIHHSIFFADSLTIYAGRLDPDPSLIRVCEELDRQLQTWYDSLSEAIKPDLSGDIEGRRQSRVLRLRYWSARQNIYRPFVIYVTSQTLEDQDTDIPPALLEMCRICLSSCRSYILTCSHILSLRTPYTYSSAQW